MAYRRRRSMSKKRGLRRRRNPLRKRMWRRNKRNKTVTARAYVPADRQMVRLRYADIMSWSVPTGTLASTYKFQSSLYSPRTAGGHQPLFYDQWCPTFYNRYRVFGIKYEFTFINPGINETWWCAVEHENTAVSTTSMQTLLERGIAKAKTGGQQYSPHNRKVIRGYMDVAKTLGIPKKEVLEDSTFQAVYNTSPAKVAYLAPYIVHNNAGTATFDVIARLTYYAVLEEKFWQSAS